MQFDAHCIECLVHRHYKLAMAKGDGEKADAYLRDVMQAILDAPKGVAAPWLTDQFSKAYDKYWPGEDAYGKLKQDSNDLVLELLPGLRSMVEQAEDPLKLALKFARTGNFLDFGILTPEVAHEALQKAITETPEAELDEETYETLKKELETAENLLILGDNCGEIVFDILLVEQLKKHYPKMRLQYCVRGRNSLNDATRADTAYVGLDKLVEVLDNGSGISGTEPDYVGEELKTAMEQADIILAKGSGNMECLAGCGLNIYYIFMCKCQRMAKLLNCENMTGQFLREKTLPPINPMAGPL